MQEAGVKTAANFVDQFVAMTKSRLVIINQTEALIEFGAFNC